MIEHSFGETIWDVANDWYDMQCGYDAGVMGTKELKKAEEDLFVAITEFINDARHP
jgi:hypothetical protein